MLAAVITSALALAGGSDASAVLEPWVVADQPHTISASFERRSYKPGEVARLTIRTPGPAMTLRVFRCGPPAARSGRGDTMTGAPVTDAVEPAGRLVSVPIGDWPSGLYFARLEGSGSGVGFAPFVVRPRRLGASRVAVVLPTNTWQAYNFRDDNGDGIGDTWYADPRIHSIDLTRPFLQRGVPPHFRGYDEGFLWWLALHGRRVDMLADDDLGLFKDARQLFRRYDLVIFSGHDEYVTAHAYDVIQRYRDLGGNLLFLSANNFYYRVERHGSRLYKIGHWSDLGRDGEKLTGEVYAGWSHGRYPNRPFVVSGAAAAPWFFAGTGLRNGARFGGFGIEINQRGPSPPLGLVVLARIADAFGPGRSAEMTYYTTPAGGKVFSAGVMNFGGGALWPVVSRLLENLWLRTARP
jgi:hypothetical protein